MEKLTDSEIVNLVRILTGETLAIGDSDYDDEVLKNIQKVLDVVEKLIDLVGRDYEDSMTYMDSSLASVQRCTERIERKFNSIKETIRGYLEPYEEAE